MGGDEPVQQGAEGAVRGVLHEPGHLLAGITGCVGEDEEELIEWIQTWKQEKRETGREIHVERSHGNGQKRARFRSTGE